MDELGRLLDQTANFARHWLTRYLAAWLLTAGLIASCWTQYTTGFNDSSRRDGGAGHATIDFGGQYLMGWLLLHGQGDHLYDRTAYWQAAWAVYPAADAAPTLTPEEIEAGVDPESKIGDRRDAATVVTCYMEEKNHPEPGRIRLTANLTAALTQTQLWPTLATAAAAEDTYDRETLKTFTNKNLGGPLYPPVNAFLYAPLALLKAATAYRVVMALGFVFALVGGLGFSVLTRGRLWWPVATALILLYPGFRGAVQLGQNAPLSLAVAIWGWALAARGRDTLGGIVWGLFAFKPVWGLALFLLPVLTGRWRFCIAMVITGNVLAAATLPAVGLECWRDWLKVGKIAADLYDVDKNWIFLSRDLLGIARRGLIDFTAPTEVRNNVLVTVASWGTWLIVFELTLAFAIRGRIWRADPAGPLVAAVATGAALCCYHFMYYDILLTAFGAILLFDRVGRFFATPGAAIGRGQAFVNSPTIILFALVIVVEQCFGWLSLTATIAGPVLPTVSMVGGQTVEEAHQLLWIPTTNVYGPPWDTLAILLLWLWAGLTALGRSARPAEG